MVVSNLVGWEKSISYRFTDLWVGGEPFFPFKDRTSETETYPKGRYLFTETMPGGRVLIDFNRAYNPFCEYNEKYTCTFAPEENWLGIAIRAGEKRFR